MTPMGPTAKMLRRRKFRPLALCFFSLLVCAFGAPVLAALPAEIEQKLAAAGLPGDAMAVLVQRAGSTKTVIAYQADRPMAPASTLKLVTTLVGIEKLGPIYRGKTEFLSAASQRGTVLDGDLILRGGGDGDLDWEAFFHMLQTLRYHGITEIRGDLIVDRNLFQPARMDIGVPPFDESPEFRYNVIPDALLLNTNLLRFDMESDGTSLAVRITPPLDRVAIDVDMTLIDGTCSKWEDGWKLPQTTYVDKGADSGNVRIRLQGTFPRNCAANTEINVIERARYADLLFRQLWTYLGGTISGKVREAGAGEGAVNGAKVLALHRSRPLAEGLREINKPSDNPLARLLFLTLGTLDKQAEGPTLSRAETEVREWFKKHGIDDSGLVLDNGSGLSRSARIKPAQLTGLLQAGWRSNWAPEFMSSMPIAGVDGTLRRRMTDSTAKAPSRLKTGTLKDVSAIAGYVNDADGDPCIVVVMINHERAVNKVARPIIDAFVDWVGRQHTR